MGLEIPERAEYLRVLRNGTWKDCKSSRLVGTNLLDIGAVSPFLYAFREREMIINLLNELCGARLTFNYMRVGGVKWDAPDGWIEKVEEFVPYMREQLAGYHDLVSGNEIFLNRVKALVYIAKKMQFRIL